MKEDRFPELTPLRACGSGHVSCAAISSVCSGGGPRGLAPPTAPGVEPLVERTRNGARWMSFALALNWVALAIVDVERHRMAGLLGWYQAQEERGVTPKEVAFLSGASAVKAGGSRRGHRRRSR